MDCSPCTRLPSGKDGRRLGPPAGAAVTPIARGLVEVGTRIWMPLRAARLSAVMRGKGSATQNVGHRQDWLKVIWVNARSVLAEMVDLEALRYRANKVLPRPAMRVLAPRVLAAVESPVTATGATRRPDPAVPERIDLRPEPLLNSGHRVAQGGAGVLPALIVLAAPAPSMDTARAAINRAQIAHQCRYPLRISCHSTGIGSPGAGDPQGARHIRPCWSIQIRPARGPRGVSRSAPPASWIQ